MNSNEIKAMFSALAHLLMHWRGGGTSTAIRKAVIESEGAVIVSNSRVGSLEFANTTWIDMQDIAPRIGTVASLSKRPLFVDNVALLAMAEGAITAFDEYNHTVATLQEEIKILKRKHEEYTERVEKQLRSNDNDLAQALRIKNSEIRDHEKVIKATAEMLADREGQILALQIHVIRLEDYNYVNEHKVFSFNDRAKLAEYVNNSQNPEVIKERIAKMNQAWKDAGKPSDTNTTTDGKETD